MTLVAVKEVIASQNSQCRNYGCLGGELTMPRCYCLNMEPWECALLASLQWWRLFLYYIYKVRTVHRNKYPICDKNEILDSLIFFFLNFHLHIIWQNITKFSSNICSHIYYLIPTMVVIELIFLLCLSVERKVGYFLSKILQQV